MLSLIPQRDEPPKTNPPPPSIDIFHGCDTEGFKGPKVLTVPMQVARHEDYKGGFQEILPNLNLKTSALLACGICGLCMRIMSAVVNTLLSDSARSLSEHKERKRMRHEVELKQQLVEEWRSDGWGHGWKAAHADFPVKRRTRSLCHAFCSPRFSDVLIVLNLELDMLFSLADFRAKHTSSGTWVARTVSLHCN